MKTEDLTNKQFGRWKVLYRANNDKYGAVRWHCKCECGTEKDVLGKTLRNGTSISCGCYMIEQASDKGKQTAKDMTGLKFGKLTVLKRYGTNDDNKATWLCKCDCGNTTIVSGRHLRDGTTLSCGCLRKDKLINRNHNLTKIKEGDSINGTLIKNIFYENGKAYCMAVCKYCGNNFKTTIQHLQSNHTQSCGCNNASFGEQKIEEILLNNNIAFIKQKIFEDFFYKDTLQHPKFDFYIISEKPYVIEYDGIQHFHANGGWCTEEVVELNKKRDKIKNEYCKNNNIPIIRIPYLKYNTLSINDLLLDKTEFLCKEANID